MEQKAKKQKRVWRWLRNALLVYLGFCLVGGLVPYISPPAVDPQAGGLFSTQWRAEGEGPDRALLIEHTGDALDVRIQMLRTAKTEISLVCHTVQPGDSTEALLGEVVLAADRGVAVRIVLDGKAGAMGRAAQQLMSAVAAHPGIELRYYNPVHLLKPWQWNALLHDKILVVDGEMLLLGGRNIGDAYFAPTTYTGPVTNDRDVFVWRSGGAAASVLPEAQSYIDSLWNGDMMQNASALRQDKAQTRLDELRAAARGYEVLQPQYYAKSIEDYRADTVPTNKITLVYNPINPGVKQPWVGWAMADILESATQSALIQTPYATANPHYLQALAASAGQVETRLLTNSAASSPNYPAYSGYHARRGRFAATGTSIFEYQSGDSIHGKSLLVDGDLAAVGSFNMDDRSLALDTETMLVIHSEPFAQQLARAMDDYLGQSLEVDAQGKGYLPGDVAAAPLGRGKNFLMWLFSWISLPLRFLI